MHTSESTRRLFVAKSSSAYKIYECAGCGLQVLLSTAVSHDTACSILLLKHAAAADYGTAESTSHRWSTIRDVRGYTITFVWTFAKLNDGVAECGGSDEIRCWDHSLRASGSRVLTATGLVNGDYWLSTPTVNRRPLSDGWKILHGWLRPRPLPQYQIWCKSVHRALVGKWVKYDQFIHLIERCGFHPRLYARMLFRDIYQCSS